MSVAGPQRPSRPIGAGAPASATRRSSGESLASGFRTTPGILRTAGTVIVVLLVLTCTACLVSGTARTTTDQEIVTRIDPLNSDVGAIYRGLAAADAAVISGYLGIGDPSTVERQDYDDDIATAGASLAAAAGRADDPATADRIAFLVQQLPVYTGLVEQARAADKPNQPAGSAYLDKASALMQDAMLPVADSLQQRQARRLSSALDETSSVPVTALVLVSVTAVALITLQVVVARRFHRVINPALLAATIAVLFGLGWWTVAGGHAQTYLDAARAHGRAVGEALVPAQIAALQARTTEGLSLVRRTVVADEPAFVDRMELLARHDGAGGALGASTRLVTDPGARAQVAEAVLAANAYGADHEQVRAAAVAGRNADAAELALTGASATAFKRINASLDIAVDAERRAFSAQMSGAQAWRSPLVVGSIAIAILAIAGVLFGLGVRLDEYQNPLRGVPAPTRQARAPGPVS